MPRTGYSHLLSGVVIFSLVASWAFVMVVLGLLCLTEWGERGLLSQRIATPLGLSLIGLGQFVFTAGLACRLCPRASRLLTDSVMALSFGLFVLGIASLAGIISGVAA